MAVLPKIIVRWEYHILKHSGPLDDAYLNEFGQEGWEALSAQHTGGVWFVMLKRAILESE